MRQIGKNIEESNLLQFLKEESTGGTALTLPLSKARRLSEVAEGNISVTTLMPDLARLAAGGRVITLAFDEDEVTAKMAKLLEAAGADVRVAVWDSSEESISIDNAISFEEWQKVAQK